MVDRTGDKRVLDIYRKLATVRMNSIPYIYNEARHVSQNCEPLMRPLFIDNPEDSNVFNIEFEYMFGRSLLVAPVTEEGVWQRNVYLPKGEWIDFWNGNIYEGNRYIRYICDLDSIPTGFDIVFIDTDVIFTHVSWGVKIIHEKFKDIKIILISNTVDYLDLAFDTHITGYILKPLCDRNILNSIERAVKFKLAAGNKTSYNVVFSKERIALMSRKHLKELKSMISS